MPYPCDHCGHTWGHGRDKQRFLVALDQGVGIDGAGWWPMCAKSPPSAAIRYVRDLGEKFVPPLGKGMTVAVYVRRKEAAPEFALRWIIEVETVTTRKAIPDSDQHDRVGDRADDTYRDHIFFEWAVQQGDA